jgi:uncharacterized NAD(P)/FAD-binding protein YdhS
VGDGGARVVAVLGAGPRGASVVERLVANAGGEALRIEVVDPYPPGPGRIWRPDQPGHLLMNTLAGQATLFTDDTIGCAGPVVPGPDLYEWARIVAVEGHEDAAVVAEARRLTPWSHPTRSFQGHYYAWFFERVLATAPASVRIAVHRHRATGLRDRPDGRQEVLLDGGAAPLVADAVVITVGHVDLVPDRGERELAAAGPRYLPPAHPPEWDLTPLRPGEPVLVRGLGMNFFDLMSLLTIGRGGRFEGAPGGLRYRPSGREPVLWVGSRRGVPYRGKPVYGSLPPVYPPRFFDSAAVVRLRAAGAVDFRVDVWPLMARDALLAHYQTLHEVRPAATALEIDAFGDRLAEAAWGPEVDAAVARAVPDPLDRLDLAALDDPLGGLSFVDRDALGAWMLDFLRRDVAEARLATRSPVKAAANSLGTARNWLRVLVADGGVAGGSYRRDLLGWFQGFAAALFSGPPTRRVEELVALTEAGLVGYVGAGMTVAPDGDAFAGASPGVGGPPLRAGALVEARLPEPDLARTADPLLRAMVAAGQARPYRMGDPGGPPFVTGGLDVTTDGYRVVAADGTAHPARFALGIPIESVRFGTALGAAPRAGATLLAQTDAVARSALSAGSSLSCR